MKSTATWIFLSLAFHSTSWAQSGHIFCGNEIFSSILRKHYPALEEAHRATFDDAKNSTYGRGDEELTLQVMVHVVWKDGEENLHDSIIADQIRVLNEDFNRQNADTLNLRPFFEAAAGSANIRFELAGIQRVQTSIDFEIDLLGTNLLAEVKHTDQGGSDAIDPERYINIWVCHIQPIEIFGIEVGQVLGFAFPPNNLPHWPKGVGAPSPDEDGVVIDYRVFGSNNTNMIQIPGGGGDLIIKGRTTVHEVGHYLGLRHIWGDGGLLGSPNDCAQSDGIDDTPYANAQSAFDCDVTKNSCSGIEAHYGTDAPDLIENYMDYASEECMNMFTHGQCELMRNILQGPRSGLIMPFSSLQDVNPGFDFALFPHPVHNTIQVQLDITEATRGFWQIASMQGDVIHIWPEQYFPVGQHQVQLDATRLSAGLYILAWQSHRGIIGQKFLKN